MTSRENKGGIGFQSAEVTDELVPCAAAAFRNQVTVRVVPRQG